MAERTVVTLGDTLPDEGVMEDDGDGAAEVAQKAQK